MYIYTYYFFSLLFVFLSVYIVFPFLCIRADYVIKFAYTKSLYFMRQNCSRVSFSFRFSLHLSNVDRRDYLHCQLLPFVCSRDRVFRTFCRLFAWYICRTFCPKTFSTFIPNGFKTFSSVSLCWLYICPITCVSFRYTRPQ